MPSRLTTSGHNREEKNESDDPMSTCQTSELEGTRSHFDWTTANDFLEEFFPLSKTVNLEPEMTELGKWQDKVVGTGKEDEVQTGTEWHSLITEFLNFLLKNTELEFWDVHKHADPKEYDGSQSENKPDFMAVKRDELKPDRDCCRDMNRIYLEDLTYFQHRTACYLILFVSSEARIVRWSPKQTICTEPFEFTDRHQFKKFCRFVRFHGSPAANRGIDTHFTPAERTVAEDAANFFNKNKEIIEQARFSVPKASDIWELNLPALSPPNAPCSQPSMYLIVGRMDHYRSSLRGRNGKYFVGYPKKKPESIYFVKANWAYTGESDASESEVYHDLRESQHVQEMIYGGYPKDIEDCSYTLKNSPHTKSRSSGKRADPDQRLHFLVLPFVRPLLTFRNGYELVEGLHGALQGLLDMYLAGYLHRDVSPSNVGLKCSGDGVKGVLQDFDLAVSLDLTGTSRAVV
ncbi:hypothetical protein BT69DRAFT_1341360 [Atractiella rhizophila]|nr:hypothetical protein BT69DRAFT_1341360 [Atractiella rhizophila]